MTDPDTQTEQTDSHASRMVLSHGIWFYQRRIPTAALRAAYGKQHWTHSLKTKCRRTAEPERNKWDRRYDRVIRDAEHATPAAIKDMVAAGGINNLARMVGYAHAASEASANLAATRPTEEMVADVIAGRAAQSTLLMSGLAAEALPHLLAGAARLESSLAAFGRPVAAQTLPAEHDPKNPKTWTIRALAADWFRVKGQAPQTRRKWEKTVRRLVEYLGTDPLASSVTTSQAQHFIADAMRLPVPLGAPKRIAHATMPNALRWADANPAHPSVDAPTVARMVACLRALGAHGRKTGAMPVNVFLDVDKPRDTRGESEQRRDLSNPEIARIVAGAVAQWGKADPRTIYVHLALYSGLRITEAVGLEPADLFPSGEKGGGWCIHIHRTDEKGNKVPSADRTIPVHSAIAPMLEAYRATVADDAPFLFALTGATIKARADGLTDDMGALMDRVGIVRTASIAGKVHHVIAPTHALRHAYATEGDERIGLAQLGDKVRKYLIGHAARDKVDARYGRRVPSLKLRRKAIETLWPHGLGAAGEGDD